MRNQSMSETTLPDFDNPPVVETVLGVQFDAVDDLTNAHLGAFWSEVKNEWPEVQHAPPLETQFERFEEEPPSWLSAALQFQVTQDPSCRILMRNATGDRMIQVQKSRFHYNWVGGHQGRTYPRYDDVRPEFDKAYDRFLKFLKKMGIGVVTPNQWEVTYVNHVPKEVGLWESPSEWNTLFSDLPQLGDLGEIASLEGLQGEWHYEITPKKGRLHVQILSGVQTGPSTEKRELLVMKLTARGAIDGSIDLNNGLNLGRQTIVRAFSSLISSKARTHWGGE